MPTATLMTWLQAKLNYHVSSTGNEVAGRTTAAALNLNAHNEAGCAKLVWYTSHSGVWSYQQHVLACLRIMSLHHTWHGWAWHLPGRGLLGQPELHNSRITCLYLGTACLRPCKSYSALTVVTSLLTRQLVLPALHLTAALKASCTREHAPACLLAATAPSTTTQTHTHGTSRSLLSGRGEWLAACGPAVPWYEDQD